MTIREFGVGILVSFTFIITSFSLMAQDDKEKILTKSEIIQNIEKINSGKMEDFLEDISKLDKEVSFFLKSTQEQCSSDLIEVSVDKDGNKKINKKRISRKEKNKCLFELFKFKIKYTKLAYAGRQKYLNFIHENQNKELRLYHEAQVKEIENLLLKYQPKE